MFSGKSSSLKPPERKNDKQESSEKASKELAEDVANNHHMEAGSEQNLEKSCDSSLPKNEGNNNESNVNGVCGDHPSTEPNDLNEENSKEEACKETFTESGVDAVAISASGS